jgi:Zn-finger protein
VPFLSCPSCGLTITETRAGSPFQACPRCLLRHRAHRTMQLVREPRRFTRDPADLERFAEARARLSGRVRGVGSA